VAVAAAAAAFVALVDAALATAFALAAAAFALAADSAEATDDADDTAAAIEFISFLKVARSFFLDLDDIRIVLECERFNPIFRSQSWMAC